MLSTLADSLVFAAEAAEEHSDKTLFYVLGGAAAVWAIVLFAIGMRSPGFPGTPAAQRVVTLVSVLVVLAAMAGSVLTT